MSGRMFHSEDFKPGRLTKIFALLSVVFVGVLASAPIRPFFEEWRDAQKLYNTMATQSGAAPVPIAIQQIWKPKLGITDRCVTCHLGMGNTTPLAGEKLFRAHPSIPHDPKEFGCTVCHGGQGRATSEDAAHGLVSFWDEQMLDVRHQSAGCGSCHNTAPVIAQSDLERGRRLVESLDCLSCHPMDGAGRGTASNLSYVGLKGYAADWHALHLKKRAEDKTGVWASSYGEISANDLAVMDTFLRTRVGMPRVIQAQALAMERGCLGCHKVQGRGGDDGPALDNAGRKPVGDLNFAGVPGKRTLVNYMQRHLIDPAGVVPASQMPPSTDSLEEADVLTTYVLFLRSRELPAEFLPKDRVRREALRESPAPMTPEQLFGAYCAGCHAPNGEGRNYGSIQVRFPAIGSPDFLDVASDEFIESTLKTGRVGRKMPPLAAPGASLSAADAKELVAFLRKIPAAAPLFADVERASSDRAAGEVIYRADCATCHGERGEGTALGSPLATPDAKARGRAALYKALIEGTPNSAMPRYSRYAAVELRSVLDFTGAMPTASGSRATWRKGTGNPTRGQFLYEKNCAGCHGDKGDGKLGPALANAGFQKVASEEFVAITVVRGRAGTPMPSFGRDSANFPRLSAEEVLDIAAFVKRGLGKKETAQGK